MRVLLPSELARQLRSELQAAGRREVGGVLMGERLAADAFRIVELSVQRRGGSVASFVREPAEHADALVAFFERTGRRYERFNYLGEWHSHPSFLPTPSATDLGAMRGIVEDPAVGAHFAVLLVVRLDAGGGLAASATAVVRGRPEVWAADLEIEDEGSEHD